MYDVFADMEPINPLGNLLPLSSDFVLVRLLLCMMLAYIIHTIYLICICYGNEHIFDLKFESEFGFHMLCI